MTLLAWVLPVSMLKHGKEAFPVNDLHLSFVIMCEAAVPACTAAWCSHV